MFSRITGALTLLARSLLRSFLLSFCHDWQSASVFCVEIRKFREFAENLPGAKFPPNFLGYSRHSAKSSPVLCYEIK